MFRNLFAVALMVSTSAVLAHDHNRLDLSKWFAELYDRKGDLCCDGSEAMHLSEVDWEITGNHPLPCPRADNAWGLRARWLAPPTWKPTLYGPMGVSIRCFIPGTMM
ncbi:hypothetical protein [Bradyrhizobium sp. 174]|uniref:hypothetical protein n=2 Tax=Bradyrhizobium TaxID=374 RepID=UPI001FF95C8C|nr:hypothetical protein [Bradyrhizobium sp. 174]MCK1573573.1 hypothetical protein [Bradyrhizobium sp. 174]